VPTLSPHRNYQLSVLPDGPEVLSSVFFNNQPLKTKVPGVADTYLLTSDRASVKFSALDKVFKNAAKATVEKAVRGPAAFTRLDCACWPAAMIACALRLAASF
jgi:hypothetical protein